jgi:hypothetical protein
MADKKLTENQTALLRRFIAGGTAALLHSVETREHGKQAVSWRALERNGYVEPRTPTPGGWSSTRRTLTLKGKYVVLMWISEETRNTLHRVEVAVSEARLALYAHEAEVRG